jgi:hypothetical protein
MSGLDLQEMEASSMLDVLHYLMEEEMIRQHRQETDIPGAVRDYIYRELYDIKYPYYTPVGGRRYSADGNNIEALEDPLDGVAPFNPKDGGATPVKAYTPPTEIDPTAQKPFGALLDSPLG